MLSYLIYKIDYGNLKLEPLFYARRPLGVSMDQDRKINIGGANLNEAENEFIGFLDFSLDYIFTLDENSVIIYANEAARNALGYAASEICGKNYIEIYPGGRRDEAARAVKEAMEGSGGRCAIPLAAGSGGEIPVETRFKKGKWKSRPVTISVSRDISDKEVMRGALTESEQRWDFALKCSRDGVWDWNAVTNEVFFSKQWKEMLGYEEHELSNSLDEWEKRVHPDDIEGVRRELDRHLAGETAYYRSEHRLRAKDGSYIWILDRGMIVSRTPDGKPLRLVGTHSDITYRKLAEKELIRAKDAAEKASLAKGRFLANMSHEIRTPMNAILGFLDLLSESGISGEQLEYVRQAHSSSKLLLYLLNDILDFSKIEAGRISMEKIEFSPRRILEDTVKMLLHKAEAKNLYLRFEIADDVPEKLIGDPGRLNQILNNIIHNAIKFTGKGGISVKVSLAEDFGTDAAIRFEIKDTGIGISESAIVNLFKPFSQADESTTRKYGGTGLGLAISRELARIMDGDITIESVEGEGTAFFALLKFGVAKRRGISRAADEPLKNIKTLITVSAGAPAEELGALIKDAGGETAFAVEGEKAVAELSAAAAAGKKFDVVIAGQNINGMSPCELAFNINSIETLRGVKIIPVHPPGRRHLSHREECTFCFSGHISQPFERGAVIGSVLKALGRETLGVENFHGISSPRPDIQTQSAGRTPGRKLEILLAEDNSVNRKLIGSMLKSRGYRFDLASDGKEALEKCLAKRYDVVLMDCQMPVMDGYESAGKIKHYLAGSGSPYIVAMTANAMEGDREKCLEAGMDEYISKPINFKLFFGLLEKRACAKYGAGKGPREISFDKVFDEFYRETGLDEADAREVFLEYIESLSKNFLKIKEALETSDFKTLKSVVHQLKGSAGTMKFRELADNLKELEQAVIAEDAAKSSSMFELISKMFE